MITKDLVEIVCLCGSALCRCFPVKKNQTALKNVIIQTNAHTLKCSYAAADARRRFSVQGCKFIKILIVAKRGAINTFWPQQRVHFIIHMRMLHPLQDFCTWLPKRSSVPEMLSVKDVSVCQPSFYTSISWNICFVLQESASVVPAETLKSPVLTPHREVPTEGQDAYSSPRTPASPHLRSGQWPDWTQTSRCKGYITYPADYTVY